MWDDFSLSSTRCSLFLHVHCKPVAYQSMVFVPAGRGGASIYGKQFEDELHPELKFTGNMIRKEADVDANVECLLAL